MELAQIRAEQKHLMGHRLLVRTAIQLAVYAHLVRSDPAKKPKSSAYHTTIVVAC